MGKPKGKGKQPAKRTVQVGLKDVGGLPLLKKPYEQCGKVLHLLGSYWGSACPARTGVARARRLSAWSQPT